LTVLSDRHPDRRGPEPPPARGEAVAV